MRFTSSFGVRCVGLGLLLLAIGIALRWSWPWAVAGLLQPLLETLHEEHAAVLLALHVAAMAVLTAGILGARGAAAISTCAFWGASGALFELAQHPAAIRWLLAMLPDHARAGGLADSLSLLIVNARFSISELSAALVGGVAAYALIVRVQSARPAGTRGRRCSHERLAEQRGRRG